MSLYRFTAFDATGKEHEGTVQAPDAQAAAKQLSAQGLRVRMIQESKGSPTPAAPQAHAVPRPVSTAPQRIKTAPPQPRVAPTPAAPQIVNMPAASMPAVFHTAAGTDKERFFLFSQIASGLRAGINPAAFFNEIAPRAKGVYRDSLQKLANSATEGIPMSSVMGQYPDLYPPGVVGAVRAGEQGGFLPDACDMIAQQAENSHKFKRFFWWVSSVTVSGLICVPAILVFRIACLAAFDEVDKRGGGSSQQVVADMLHSAWQSFLWPYGPATAAFFALWFIIWRFTLASASLKLRHKLGLAWPVFGKRAKHENLTVFSWTMSRLTAAGLPHQAAWEMAAAAVPNLAMQGKLLEIGKRTANSEKISEAVGSSRLFPQEYAPTISTAELTGDLPGAMEQLSRTSRTEFEAQQNYAKLRGAGWGCLATMVTSGFVLAVALWMWYREIPAKMLKDDTP